MVKTVQFCLHLFNKTIIWINIFKERNLSTYLKIVKKFIFSTETNEY